MRAGQAQRRGRMCTPHTPPRPPLTPRLLPAAPAPLAPALPGCDGADIKGKGSPSCGPVRGFEAPGRQAWSPQVEAPAADSSVPRAARRPRPGAASPRTPALRFASPHSPLRPGRFPARAPAPRQGPRLGPGARRRTRLTCASARRQVPLPRRGIQVTPPERIPARRQRFGPCRSRCSAGHPPRPRVHPSPPRARAPHVPCPHRSRGPAARLRHSARARSLPRPAPRDRAKEEPAGARPPDLSELAVPENPDSAPGSTVPSQEDGQRLRSGS